MFFPFWDPSFFLVLPGLALAMFAQWKVRSTYEKMSQVPAACGRTGRQVAEAIMAGNGISGIQIEEVGGVLSDNFDPRSKTVHLSSDIYSGTSVAAIAIAAHEIGHVIQHDKGYAPIAIRDAIVPVASVGSWAAFPLFFLGFFFHSQIGLTFMNLGIALFGIALLFQVVTLPTEFDASSRAMNELQTRGILGPGEVPMARQVLNAAALTYVAATAVAALQLLRLVLLRNSRN